MPDSVASQMVRRLALCHVPRWCIVPHLRPQSVAEHTYGVMAIYRALWAYRGIAAVIQLDEVMDHDLDEADTGDLPSSSKPGRGSRPTAPHLIPIKVADFIESMTYIEKWGCGAHAIRVASQMAADLRDYLQSSPDTQKWDEAAHKVLHAIREDYGRWDNPNRPSRVHP